MSIFLDAKTIGIFNEPEKLNKELFFLEIIFAQMSDDRKYQLLLTSVKIISCC